MSNEVLLSPEGYEHLKAELERLKTVERMKIADNLREARSHGDLRENAMYHEAKLNQKRLEGKIADLESVIQLAKVVDENHHGSGATLGSKVTVKDLGWDETLTVTLVGSYDADPLKDLVSVSSPLGKALFGREAGDLVEVDAPAGLQRYEVLAVE